jgi:hypothetical protein
MEQVETEHAELVILALVARQRVAASKEHEVIGAVP